MLFDIHFRSSLEIVDLQLSPPRNCKAQMYKDIWFLATQNTFKNCTKLGTIYVMRQIWQSRDNMWSQCTQWVEILLKVAFYFLWTCVFTKYLCTIHVTIARLKWSLTGYAINMEEQKETHWESTKASDYLFFLANSAVYKAGICWKLPWLVRSYFLLPHYRRNVWYLLKTLCTV